MELNRVYLTIPRSMILRTSVRLVESSTNETFLIIPANCKYNRLTGWQWVAVGGSGYIY